MGGAGLRSVCPCPCPCQYPCALGWWPPRLVFFFYLLFGRGELTIPYAHTHAYACALWAGGHLFKIFFFRLKSLKSGESLPATTTMPMPLHVHPGLVATPTCPFFFICFKEGGRLPALYVHAQDNVRALEVRGHTALIPAVFCLKSGAGLPSPLPSPCPCQFPCALGWWRPFHVLFF